MKKRAWLSVILAFVFLLSIVAPTLSVQAETNWNELDKKIQEIKRLKNEAAKRQKSVEYKLNSMKSEKKDLQREIKSIESQIIETEDKVFALENQIVTITEKAKVAANELEQAEKRVEERDELLKTRVRLMYRKGSVDYVEVLLGSNGFSDFLQRFGALQKIVDSDKKILQDNINDKNTIEEKKREIDKALANLETLYTETEQLKRTLVARKEDRRVKIASIEEKEEELEDVREEEAALVNELASKESALIQQKYKLEYSGGKFLWPVPASRRITSDYGRRLHPILKVWKGHTGLDIGRAPGTSTLYGADIIAPEDGVVILAGYVNGYGNTIMIDHGSGIWTLYGHIRNGGIMVKIREKVEKGQKIAEVGSTGRSTGPHLHFEIKKDKKPVNPWNYLK